MIEFKLTKVVTSPLTRVEQAMAFESQPAGPMTRLKIEQLEDEIRNCAKAETRYLTDDDCEALRILSLFRQQCRG